VPGPSSGGRWWNTRGRHMAFGRGISMWWISKQGISRSVTSLVAIQLLWLYVFESSLESINPRFLPWKPIGDQHEGSAPGCFGYCGKTSAILFCLGAHVVGPRRGGSESGRKSEGFAEKRANGRCAGKCSGRCSPAPYPVW